jgi:alkaline phosphatase/streptomycin-6-phosphatase
LFIRDRKHAFVRDKGEENGMNDMHRRRAVRIRRAAMVGAAALLAIAVALPAMGSPTARTNGQRHPRFVRNVILLIGDGMGDSEITIARNYALGAAGQLDMGALPFTGQMTTYSLQEGDPALPDYVPDSAATGTAWSTGTKTSNGRISTTAGADQDLTTILEKAEAAGYLTGNVSTARLTDATPAVLMSHVNDRGCEGPSDMANCPLDLISAGGHGSIAEQSITKGIDVLLGGAADKYGQTIVEGPNTGTTAAQAAADGGYSVVTDEAGLDAATPGAPLLGLFAQGHMDLEWTGALATPYPGSGPQQCAVNPTRSPTQPDVDEMTAKALELLDKERWMTRAKGFFLQVEGASIDKQDHAANPCGQIGETIAFDRAVGVALAFAAHHPGTLVIVTADHAHTSQIIPLQSETDHSPGLISTLITADGAQMVVNYATNLEGRSQEHTGSQLRVAAWGPGATQVMGLIDQTHLFEVMRRQLGLW